MDDSAYTQCVEIGPNGGIYKAAWRCQQTKFHIKVALFMASKFLRNLARRNFGFNPPCQPVNPFVCSGIPQDSAACDAAGTAFIIHHQPAEPTAPSTAQHSANDCVPAEFTSSLIRPKKKKNRKKNVFLAANAAQPFGKHNIFKECVRADASTLAENLRRA